MQKIKLKIIGIPVAKQSVRSGISRTKFGKLFIQHYQPEKIKQKERNFAFDVKSQLPKDFKPFRTGISVKATFIFPPLKNFTLKKLKELESGAKIYKTTRPDLHDNLMKLTMDAMNGIVFKDDSLIVKVESEKIYGLTPCVELEFQEL
ncbi:RusA family crossover junction endodeoxyribonuclease [Chryseobacterium indologenes]|uniref:RusA family crossover junction endodeoxyribonuclease n=1 Tax=Chryseobacterium indologenes TaxID=253 RepID=UPI000789417D|nr:RusA family crossover junction endodeoxyribonuclease [Chryseobacterium indologenes]